MQTKKIFLFVALISVVYSILYPIVFSLCYNVIALILFITEVILYHNIIKRTNYLNFDTIFLLIFGISAFAFPVFFYLPQEPFLYFFGLSFDINAISRAVGASLLASTSFLIGGIVSNERTLVSTKKTNKIISNRGLIFLVVLFILSFFMLGGISVLQSTYKKDVVASSGGGVFQILAILQALFIVSISTEFYNLRLNPYRHFNRILLFVTILFSFVMFYVGNRTYALIIILPIAFYYTNFYRKISLFRFCMLLPLAFIFMYIIQVTRTGSSMEGRTIEAVTLFRDIVIPCRSNYLVYEVIEKEGFSFGETMSGGIIGVIPSLERVLKSFMNLESYKIGSAGFFTYYTFGDIGVGVTGLGTMLQADAYLSFGILGIIFIFYFIGYVSNKSYRLFMDNNYYAYIVYSTFMAHAVFWIRAEATYPLKTLLWSLLIAYININIRYGKKNNVLYA